MMCSSNASIKPEMEPSGNVYWQTQATTLIFWYTPTITTAVIIIIGVLPSVMLVPFCSVSGYSYSLHVCTARNCQFFAILLINFIFVRLFILPPTILSSIIVYNPFHFSMCQANSLFFSKSPLAMSFFLNPA